LTGSNIAATGWTYSSNWVGLSGDLVGLRGSWVVLSGDWVGLRGRWVVLSGNWVGLNGNWVRLNSDRYFASSIIDKSIIP
jgi:hypothetical protein